ncbi:hypothetical protein AGJ34_20335 [Cronobacter dublinensis subsp. dublinensis]|nr:hypothetical protein [Cronobacter dublinensis subsp. dublinensis]EGT5729934.1 hypothetical protein [Cronobacter dublinensis subsp. dublinensis]
MKAMTEKKQQPLQIFDEFHSNPEPRPVDVVTLLRSAPGIPDVVYQVNDNGVFVYDLLLKILEKARLPTDPVDKRNALIEAAHAALPLATVSAAEAVTQWRIVPRGYTISDINGLFYVMNTELLSYIPVPSTSVSDAQNLLADVLAGKKIATQYDDDVLSDTVITLSHPAFKNPQSEVCTASQIFSFEGQTYRHDKLIKNSFSPDIKKLSALFPDFCFDKESSQTGHETLIGLKRSSFVKGFPLCSENDFHLLLKCDSAWFKATQNAVDSAIRHFSGHLAKLLGTFDFKQPYTDAEWQLSESDQLHVKRLREIYPEVEFVSDIALYDASLDFETRDGLCWEDEDELVRDDDFLYWLIGSKCVEGISEEYKNFPLDTVGQVVAYFLMKNLSAPESLQKGRQFAELHRELIVSKWNCQRVFEYMHQLKTNGNPALTGNRVTTFRDFFLQARSFSGSQQPVMVTQDLSQFLNTTKH